MPHFEKTQEYYVKDDFYCKPSYNPPDQDIEVYSWTSKKLASMLGKTGNILDIGCGRGDFLNFMRERGWRVQGIEIHPGLVDICESRGITCQIGELGTLSFPENFFDAITFRDVLEHIPTPPHQVLSHTAQWLKPGGVMYIKVPNLDWISGPLGKLYKRGFDPGVHLYHFSQKALRRCLERAGLKPLAWDMEPPSAGSLKKYLGYLILKLAEVMTIRRFPQVYFSLAVFACKK
ncbi:class I SAM-dependent methyltransferase [Desulfobacca acetoxidans]|nr:class I SAM-dependent methyltransferase [Desulfobacca acetoxidans]